MQATMYPKKCKNNPVNTPTPKKSNINIQKSSPVSTLNKTESTRQISSQNKSNSIKKQVDSKLQLQSQSNELQQSHLVKSDMQNEQLFGLQNQQEVQLFQKSDRKLTAIKESFESNQNVQQQLNQVLKLIKQEKTKINDTINDLKDVSDYYKTLAQSKQIQKVQISCNTQQILPPGNDIILIDTSIQTDAEFKEQNRFLELKKEYKTHHSQNEFLSQSHQNRAKTPQLKNLKGNNLNQSPNAQYKNFKQNPSSQFLTEDLDFSIQRQNESVSPLLSKKQLQTYQKLAGMLSDMNINYKSILPQNVKINIPIKNWKQLSDGQIIKIQKYFIKKLAQKISN